MNQNLAPEKEEDLASEKKAKLGIQFFLFTFFYMQVSWPLASSIMNYWPTKFLMG